MCKGQFAKSIDSAVFPRMHGDPLCHVIAAKAVAFGEALTPDFKQYIEQIVKNCQALAEALKNKGFRLCTGGSDNHLLFIDLCPYYSDPSSTPRFCNSFSWHKLRAGDFLLALQIMIYRCREIVIFMARLAGGSPAPERLQLPGSLYRYRRGFRCESQRLCQSLVP